MGKVVTETLKGAWVNPQNNSEKVADWKFCEGGYLLKIQKKGFISLNRY